MDRTLAPDVFDLLTQPRLPSPVRAAAEPINASAPIEVDEATALRVMAPLLWMTRRVGTDGLALTKAGHLRPLDVTALMTNLGWDSWWIGKNNREELTAPAGMLRRAAIQVKLVRKYKGTLRLTRAGRSLAGLSALELPGICQLRSAGLRRGLERTAPVESRGL